MTTSAWISLGSNLGDRHAILDEAMLRLGQTPGVAVARLSSYRETRPVGGPPGQGPFLNAAARLETTLSPRELLAAMQAIERDLGRVRTVRWGERTLDLDLLIYGCKFVDEPDLKVPHPYLSVRRFVLEPLAEIAPDVVDTRSMNRAAELSVRLDQSTRLLMLHRSIVSALADRLGLLADRLMAPILAIDGLEEEPRFPSSLDLMQSYIESRAAYDRREVDALSLIYDVVTERSPGNEHWLVATFVLDIQAIKRSIASGPYRNSSAKMRRQVLVEWASRSDRTIEMVPNATFIVATRESEYGWYPGGLPRSPVYWPEATEPDAIVAEVVAVCRGIERV